MSALSCEEAMARFHASLSGELSVEEAADAQKHLEGCGDCRAQAEQFLWDDRAHAELAAQEQVQAWVTRMRSAIHEPPPAAARDAMKSSRRITRRGSNVGADSGGLYRSMALVAAGLGIVAVFYAFLSEPDSGRERNRAQTRISPQARQDAQEERATAEAERREARARLAALREREEAAAKAREAADRGNEEDLRRSANEAFMAARMEREAAEQRLREADERERRAREAAPPEEKPSPALPAPRDASTEAAVARIERVEGQVTVIGPTGKSAARNGQDLGVGTGLQVVGDKSFAVLVYPDTTRLEVGPESELLDLRTDGGKQVRLATGSVRAEVAKQPAGQPMAFVTPHGQATVLGTTLRLVVDPDRAKETRLEVEEGRVRLKDLAGKTVVVESGHYAVAAKGAELLSKILPKLLLAEDFEDDRAVASRWLPVKDGFPVTSAGRLEIDLSPKPADPYPSSWHEAGGLTSRVAFRIPFRLQVDVEVTNRHPNVIAAILFLPQPTRSPKEDLPITPWVCFRGDAMSVVRDDGDSSPAVRTTGNFPRRDRWTVEVDLQEIRVFINDRETVKHKHIRSVPSYFLFLNANAKLDAPRGARVRFDNLRVEELRR